MNDKWTPSINLDLMDVINTQSIKGVQVGSPEAFIFEIMGEAELPATRLSKKSKIINHLYGNVNFLSENGYVIAINIDFHGNREKMITLGDIGGWGVNDWFELSELKGWSLNNLDGVMRILGGGIVIELSKEGELSMVSLR
ncbi:TPA: hypothetical protein ACSTJY_000598 [Serratia fonticola]|uniref:hypothetical protein n=1 Tax=Serratia fonticola TaxID=47917 RepID=UPI0021797D5E|nr:hypothetical protein [Serratia fonticola]CAI1677461.1 Uncharacterised protein [Serratia fonticola]CAI1690444.1 Uncharacterised protein [Serratia fonticola]